MKRSERQVRVLSQSMKTRAEETGDKYISGYFSVFNSNYELWKGASESVDSHAFDEALDDDIRCLINHNDRLVLGRTKAGTLALRVDDKGLWGEVKVNEKDQDAVNLYERVKRGDVDQCSFGFEILDELREENPITGDVHWTIKRVKLYEVSIVTFPAYSETEVSARHKEFEEIQKRRNEEWRRERMKRLKGEK